MTSFPKPKIVVSKCLDFDKCRYNGEVIPSKFVRKLNKYVEFLPVCPEVEIGLGTPREPIRLIEPKDELKLVQPSTNRDLTKKMDHFSKSYLNSLDQADGFILKAGSPSCGIHDVRIYPKVEPSMAKRKSSGLFAGHVLEKFSGLAIEDEGRLTNFRIREHFLTRIFLFARFREVKDSQSFKNLVNFHTANKLIFMAYSQKHMRLLGRIVADGKAPLKKSLLEYEKLLHEAMARMPRFTSHINVLMHTLGYFKKELTSKEKKYFLSLLEKYRNEIIPLSAVLTAIQSWVIRHEKDYLHGQTYFEPFPEELVDITDSGKGRSGK